jgi:hypothetical protein
MSFEYRAYRTIFGSDWNNLPPAVSQSGSVISDFKENYFLTVSAGEISLQQVALPASLSTTPSEGDLYTAAYSMQLTQQ